MEKLAHEDLELIINEVSKRLVRMLIGTSIAPSPHQAPSGDRILSQADVLKITGYSRTTIWRLVTDNKFPAPLRLSTNRIGWKQNQIDEWLKSKEL